MARTIAEIKQEMVDQKNSESALSGLTSTSQTAIWNLIFFICATAIKFIEDLFDVHNEQVEARRLEIPVGILKWYAAETLVYQFGDSLVFADGRLDYEVIDETKYVVDLSAAAVVNGIIIIKSAKITVGVAEPLSAGELSGLTQYWIEKRFAGDSLSVISLVADLLKAEYNVTYDPQVLATDGSLLTDAAAFPVEDSMDNYLQTFQTDNFAGNLQVMKLTDAIQEAQGVVNVVATNIEAKPSGGVYADVLADSQNIYSSSAGYIKIDPLFPLSTTLNYIANA